MVNRRSFFRTVAGASVVSAAAPMAFGDMVKDKTIALPAMPRAESVLPNGEAFDPEAMVQAIAHDAREIIRQNASKDHPSLGRGATFAGVSVIAMAGDTINIPFRVTGDPTLGNAQVKIERHYESTVAVRDPLRWSNSPALRRSCCLPAYLALAESIQRDSQRGAIVSAHLPMPVAGVIGALSSDGDFAVRAMLWVDFNRLQNFLTLDVIYGVLPDGALPNRADNRA